MRPNGGRVGVIFLVRESSAIFANNILIFSSTNCTSSRRKISATVFVLQSNPYVCAMNKRGARADYLASCGFGTMLIGSDTCRPRQPPPVSLNGSKSCAPMPMRFEHCVNMFSSSPVDENSWPGRLLSYTRARNLRVGEHSRASYSVNRLNFSSAEQINEVAFYSKILLPTMKRVLQAPDATVTCVPASPMRSVARQACARFRR
jgi:hypothetical protein